MFGPRHTGRAGEGNGRPAGGPSWRGSGWSREAGRGREQQSRLLGTSLLARSTTMIQNALSLSHTQCPIDMAVSCKPDTGLDPRYRLRPCPSSSLRPCATFLLRRVAGDKERFLLPAIVDRLDDVVYRRETDRERGGGREGVVQFGRMNGMEGGN